MTAQDEKTPVAEMTTEELVLEHASLVKRIAYHLITRLPPNVEVEDLIQAGMIGLLEAAGNYSSTGGANFSTFAGIRIRGAMLDEVRKLDWTPRSVHRRLRELTKAVSVIENDTGRDARDQDIAKAMQISLTDYHNLMQDAASSRMCSLDSLAADDPSFSHAMREASGGPLEALQESSFMQALVDEIDRLPEREKLVMSLYYDDELNLREIGEVLGVSESRVCQIHGQALIRLRARLTAWTGAQAVTERRAKTRDPRGALARKNTNQAKVK